MKTNLFITGLLLSAAISLNAQDYKVDVQKSNVKWLGTKVAGKHNGSIGLKSGEISLKNDKITAGTFVIDMNTIVNEDVKDAENNKNLVDHLKSDDFFGVAGFPEAKLVITNSTVFKANKALVQGDLTIKGKTNTVAFDVKRSGLNYTAKIVIDRSKYDVKYGSKSFFGNIGDNAISDEFTLDVTLTLSAK